jgi:threonine 3-dehydrogenase
MKQDRILIIGAGGQIGAVLTEALRTAHGTDNVVATDLRDPGPQNGPTQVLDALDMQALGEAVQHWGINQIYHLAAILSATGEKDPMRAWDINMRSLFNVLEVGRQAGLAKIYFPSSIAVFGREAAHYRNTPQHEVLIPETVYGISKVAGENWANYYFRRYGLDVRSMRYPGIIGYQSMPGGGTTDYAVDIYHYAVKQTALTRAFWAPKPACPCLYMPDAIRATLGLMEAPADRLYGAHQLQPRRHEFYAGGDRGQHSANRRPDLPNQLPTRLPAGHRRLLAGLHRRLRRPSTTGAGNRSTTWTP